MKIPRKDKIEDFDIEAYVRHVHEEQHKFNEAWERYASHINDPGIWEQADSYERGRMALCLLVRSEVLHQGEK
jgi:hypothetical protein